ncbi:MAG: adenosine deaminase [Candidatus Omnitrophica bacterium]|nr:adenosine deaminase [Candidatus Omnitrophota bacterium]
MGKNTSVGKYIEGLPKAELHVHIEGTFEPELMFKIAGRNNIKIKYRSVEEVRAAYKFNDLQDFLDIYYEGTSVLREEKDFYDLAYAYLEKACEQNILHSEIFFDPQTHAARGIKFKTVIDGLYGAIEDALKKRGISAKLIMCFLRDVDPVSAMKTLQEALPYKDRIVGVGLDSAEVGHPASSFKEVFDEARKNGFLTVAHAGEEGPAEYIWQALELLKVLRVDHCIHALDDKKLVEELVRRKIPLTVCPLSNVKLKVVDNIKHHPLKKMMEKGLFVTINSDDPAYFGGYINENYLAVAKALELGEQDLSVIAKNSFRASFIGESEKEKLINKVDTYNSSFEG